MKREKYGAMQQYEYTLNIPVIGYTITGGYLNIMETIVRTRQKAGSIHPVILG